MTSMCLHEALQHEPNLKNCQGIPQYIIVLADLLEYNTFDTINIKRELPNWIKKNLKNATATQKANGSQNLFQNQNSLRYRVAPNTQQQQNQGKKKQKQRNPKKKKYKEKQENTQFMSKNRKRKLRKIYEQEEYELQ